VTEQPRPADSEGDDLADLGRELVPGQQVADVEPDRAPYRSPAWIEGRTQQMRDQGIDEQVIRAWAGAALDCPVPARYATRRVGSPGTPARRTVHDADRTLDPGMSL